MLQLTKHQPSIGKRMDSGIDGLPLVAQIGFVGSRRLLDPADEFTLDGAEIGAQIEQQLIDRLRSMPSELGLSNHFLCGISQIAVGGDTLFAGACRELGIQQRILLSQPVDEYLEATGSAGPDFSLTERAAARALLSDTRIVQVQAVSTDSDRHARFEDVNLEIVNASDVLVCLLKADDSLARPGGTNDALELALRRGTPVLELRVEVADGRPKLGGTWHHKTDFDPPSLSQAKRADVGHRLAAPTLESYTSELRRLASGVANWRRRFFSAGALAVITTHLAATVLAASALVLHHSNLVPILLTVELLLLITGFAVHHRLHHSEASRVWAFTRAASELARSVRAMSAVHTPLEHLLTLLYPTALRPLARTLSVLHLAASRALLETPWSERRDAYVRERIHKQIDYYAKNYRIASRQAAWADWLFVGCTSLAGFATATKLVVAELPHHGGEHGAQAAPILGVLAIVLPVLAVGALSLMAALDRAARASIFKDMLPILDRQRSRLEKATSEREFIRLVLETEAELVREHASWFARRTFTGVS